MVCFFAFFAACASARSGVEIKPLADGVWMHTSYKDLPEIGPFPSNGLIVRTGEGVYLIDTAWNDQQTRELLAWSESKLGAPIRFAIVTHAHNDKMGGVGALHAADVNTYAHAETNKAAQARALIPARQVLELADDVAVFAGGAVEVFYPGPGHTPDNIVVYVKAAAVLFGGCLIRPGNSKSLGNVADADVEQWDATVARVKARYPSVKIVVPSHGPPAGFELFDHTIQNVANHAPH